MFGRKKKSGSLDAHSDDTLTNDYQPTHDQVKRATRTRWIWDLITAFLLLISVVFMILVEIGETQNKDVMRSTYFININLSNIIPLSVPNAVLINSIAQSVGLHDFYRVGLWGYCEGYNDQGVTSCSSPQTLYWFNPVEIIQSQLLAGATVALPAQLNNILDLIKTVSHWMFGLFLAGACLNFLMMFLVLLSVFSRWGTFVIMIFTFLGALFVTVAAVLATVMFIIMQNALTSVAQINIGATIGAQMFAFMWIAAGSAILAWIIQLCQCCCCASRRDIKKGKKRGSKKAWDTETPGVSEKQPGPGRGGFFARRK